MTGQTPKPVPRWVGIWVAAALLLLLVVAAIGARHIPTASGDSQLLVDERILERFVAYGTWAMLAIVVVWLLTGRRRRMPRSRRSSWLGAVIVLSALVILFLEFGKHMPDDTQNGEQAVTFEMSLPDVHDTPLSSIPSRTSVPPGSPGMLLIVVAGVVVIAATLAVLGRERRSEQPEVETDEPAIVAVIDDLIGELERSSDPRKIVIGAYARMEQALARDGVVRRRSEAPLEYLSRALQHLQVSGRAAEQLTALFAEARFSPHDIDETRSSAALTSLKEVREELKART
jgi:hypothetical protein